ncbi:hypothetical protein KIW84_057170 [Lathyrus oleraceus]|uniref:Reverse transcriptase domain-containing protein n=1 Tax=Pisum sativum TaxID=3888 RepID=A0A9D4X560_PEA|nr:hypothetical protein KIW84_057170 [Pisum sativum]
MEVDSSIIRSLWRNHEVGWSYSSSLGQSGGIITMWNEGSARPISSFKGEGYLELKLAWKSDIYYAVNVYSACGISLKRKIWSELIKLKRKLSDGLWIMGGNCFSWFSGDGKTMSRGELGGNILQWLKLKNGMVDSVEDIKEAIISFFKNKFAEPESSRPLLEGCSFKTLFVTEAEYFEAPFSEDEIKSAVWSCDGAKSSGPDGFTFVFVKKCWFILKEDIISFVKDFHRHAYLPKVVTSSFLALIPKVAHPINLGEYRPICLVGSLYKILAKLLAARLKRLIGGLISQCQSAFVPGVWNWGDIGVPLLLQDLVSDNIRSLKVLLAVVFPIMGSNDNISWNTDKSTIYCVREAYQLMLHNRVHDLLSIDPEKAFSFL